MWGPDARTAHCNVLKKIFTQERFMAAAHCRGTLQTFSYTVAFKSFENSKLNSQTRCFGPHHLTLRGSMDPFEGFFVPFSNFPFFDATDSLFNWGRILPVSDWCYCQPAHSKTEDP